MGAQCHGTNNGATINAIAQSNGVAAGSVTEVIIQVASRAADIGGQNVGDLSVHCSLPIPESYC
jgi:hypothetical protein